MSGFDITGKEIDDISILNLKGFLDAHTAPVFEKALQQLLKNNKVKIILNFKELEYISSAGLGVIMGFIEEIREKGGDIKMSNLSQKVYRIFDLLGFPSLYQIFDEEQEAISNFN